MIKCDKVIFNIDDLSAEIHGRIVKAEAKKYGGNIEIDFSGENRTIAFTDEDKFKKHIIQQVKDKFKT